jgi:phage gp29-like protein
MCENLLDATMKGFSVGEILWVRDGARIVPSAVKPRDQRRFLFDEQGDLRLKTLSSLMPGEELPSRKFIVHRFESKDDNPYGLGMGTRLFWPVWFKRQNIKFWLTFADRCGSPTVVGTYPAGTSLPDQAKLKAACMAISHEAGVTLPEGLAIKYLEAQIHGSINTYERLCDYMDGEISKAVLGETGTTDQQGSGGSRARDEVGDKIRLEITKADADMLCQTLNSTLITWTTEFNFPGLVPPQVWRIFGDDEDLKDRADRDKTLKETGVRFTKQYFIKAYSFEEDDIEVVDSPAPVPAPGMTGPAFAEGAALADPVMLEQAGDAIARGYQALLGRRVEDLLALLEETRDLETFRARLADLLAAPPSPAMVESLARAGFAARLQGRLTAEQMQGRLQRMKERRGE